MVALGGENTTLEMVMPVINKVSMHGLSHAVHKNITENNSGLRFNVPMLRLDDFREFKNTGKRITRMKIDVENFEYFVLRGAEKLILKNKPVIYCELWENDTRKKTFAFLNNLGYSAFIIHEKELVPFTEAFHSKNNFFFMADSLTD